MSMIDPVQSDLQNSAVVDASVIPDQDFEILKLLYNEYCSGWRHYDSHIWQIPSLAVAVNGFLIAQAFSENLIVANGNNQIVRGMMVFVAGLFTFVLLIALVKHRLHQRAKDQNIKRIEGFMPQKYRTLMFNFRDPNVLKNVEPNAMFLERWLAPAFTNHWLMTVMACTILTDAVILVGIIARFW